MNKAGDKPKVGDIARIPALFATLRAHYRALSAANIGGAYWPLKRTLRLAGEPVTASSLFVKWQHAVADTDTYTADELEERILARCITRYARGGK
jgi:hypothetical protein